MLYSSTYLALARQSKFSDKARNPAKQRSISSAVLRSLMSVGNATDKAEWRRTYGQIPLFEEIFDRSDWATQLLFNTMLTH